MPRAAPTPAVRPSLRAVARAAGVSAMTVSRVLRNHPKVTASTRARVQKVARELGYRPDPNLAKLMHHLRIRRKPAFQSSLCALTTHPEGVRAREYLEQILWGARRQADARGYAFDVLQVDEAPGPARSLQRVLRSRGVEGVLLLPMAAPVNLEPLLDWRNFSVISTTQSVLAPEFHSVLPHHYRNTQLLCRQLLARGYRRIGLVQKATHAERVNRNFGAVVTFESLFATGRFVPPLLHDGDLPAKLPDWYQRERPDVIVSFNERQCRRLAKILGTRIPGRIALAATSVRPGSTVAGINELPREIGSAAVDLLAGLVQRGAKGVPAIPTTTQVLGRWVEAGSCRRRPVRQRSTAVANVGPPLIYLEKRP